jgi:hypothetical protein
MLPDDRPPQYRPRQAAPSRTQKPRSGARPQSGAPENSRQVVSRRHRYSPHHTALSRATSPLAFSLGLDACSVPFTRQDIDPSAQ